MKLSAIIAEYNPLHKGHQYLIEKAKEETNSKVLVIMSGNFVQRGTPAIFDKWIRTQMALEAGADIVLELPVVYATASAENFASGSISILRSLGVVDYLVFGTEAETTESLQRIASFLSEESTSYKEILTKALDTGVSFPAARRTAIASLLGESIASLLDSPNNILAIEYMKAIVLQKADIKPLGILRQGSGYHNDKLLDSSTFASATAIRNAIKNGDFEWKKYILHTQCLPNPVFEEMAFPFLLYLLRTTKQEQLAKVRDVREGFENVLLGAAKQITTYEQFITLCKSKRYTQTGIQRICTNILLGITNELVTTIQNESLYAHVLGIKKESLEILSLLNENATIPIIISPAEQAFAGLDLDVKASDVYSLLQQPISPSRQDYTKKLIVI